MEPRIVFAQKDDSELEAVDEADVPEDPEPNPKPPEPAEPPEPPERGAPEIGDSGARGLFGRN